MFDLPAAPRYHLTRAPLAQALAQVRFPLRARLQTLEGVAGLQDRLEDLFPDMREQQVHEVSLVLGPAGPAEAGGGSSRSWMFTTEAGSSLIVAPDSATLSVGTEYEGVEQFGDLFKAVLQALAEETGVRTCDRLGVRYLSVAETPPTDPAAWRTWFRPELVGWPGGEVLASGTSLVTSITQTQLSAAPVGELSGPPVAVQAVVRHGFVPSGSVVPGVPPIALQTPAYFLDLDLFVPAAQPFAAGELTAQFQSLHAQIDKFFRWTLTDAGEAHFGYEETA